MEPVAAPVTRNSISRAVRVSLSRFLRMRSTAWRGVSALLLIRNRASLQFHIKTVGQEIREGHGARAVDGWEDDWRIGLGELCEHLTACAAGRAGSIVEICHGDGFDPNCGTELCDGAHQC